MTDWNWLEFENAPHQLRKGEELFKQGEPVEAMFFLSRGRVKLIRHTPDGNVVILHVASAGEMIAEASLFAHDYHCTAVVDLDSELIEINRSIVLESLSSHDDSCRRLLQLFARQIRDLRGLIEIRNVRSARERILAYLHSIADAGGRVTLESSRRDIAYKLGLAPETLYRELRKLSDEGLIAQTKTNSLLVRD